MTLLRLVGEAIRLRVPPSQETREVEIQLNETGPRYARMNVVADASIRVVCRERRPCSLRFAGEVR